MTEETEDLKRTGWERKRANALKVLAEANDVLGLEQPTDLARAREQEPESREDQFEELLAWWRMTSDHDAQRTIPKAIEYGSIDLNIIGFALGECIPALREGRREGSTEASEMGIAFYLLGKIARMVSAYSEGQRPSDDTWMDVTVYSLMGRRVRDRGSWG